MVFDAIPCKFSLQIRGRQVWSTPDNQYLNCEIHLVNNGNLYMYQPTDNVIVWRAIETGRSTTHSYDLFVSNNGTAFLRDTTDLVNYWTVPEAS
jgi:hypothetical protein